MAKSERLQMKRIAQEEGFITATTAVVFFPEETKYSIVALSLIKEINPQVGDFVHVKEQGKTHDAKLVKIGSEDACKLKVAKLEKALRACDDSDPDEAHVVDEVGGNQSDKGITQKKRKRNEEIQKRKGTNLTDCWKEKLKSEKEEFQKLMNSRDEKNEYSVHSADLDNESVQSDCTEVKNDDFSLNLLHQKVDKLFSCVESISRNVDMLLTSKTFKPGREHSPAMNPQTPQQFRKMEPRASTPGSKDSDSLAEMSFSTESEESSQNLVFEGTDLLSLPANPKNPQKYALKVLSTLFTDDELMKGMIAPVNKKGVKTELDPSRINILRECVGRKFGEKTLNKMWSTIRTSCNQKGCDLLKKKIKCENIEKIE